MQAIGTKAHETTMHGATWTLNTLPGTEGGEAFFKCMAIAGGSVREASVEGPEETLLSVMGGFASKLGEPGTMPLIKKLLGTLHKDGAPVKFDIEFAANMETMIDLTLWAVEINFGSVKKSGAIGRILEMLEKSGVLTRVASTGPSGAPSSQANAH